MTRCSELDDQELISLLIQSDHAAYTEIYNRYWQTAYRAALNVLKDEDTCLDIVQDVFVWLWNNREKLAIISLKPYLITAVKFKMLNVIRNGKFKEEAIKVMQASEISLSFIENSIEVKELKSIIEQFTETLPEQAKKIFHLSRNEHLTHKQIAEQLELSEKTVKNQINISLKRLKTSLGRMSFWVIFIF
ncbi:MAG: polymerase sigma-70 factor [Mucilaginibacter sp.]|nr:polymerase sigma-70 factor [Mucilaginibacter sp.]